MEQWGSKLQKAAFGWRAVTGGHWALSGKRVQTDGRATSPVIVHVADKQWVEGIEVSAEHRELIPNQELTLLGLGLGLQAQLLFLRHHLPCPLAKAPNGGDKMCVQELRVCPAHDGLSKH